VSKKSIAGIAWAALLAVAFVFASASCGDKSASPCYPPCPQAGRAEQDTFSVSGWHSGPGVGEYKFDFFNYSDFDVTVTIDGDSEVITKKTPCRLSSARSIVVIYSPADRVIFEKKPYLDGEDVQFFNRY
jgi:hypothetical protein